MKTLALDPALTQPNCAAYRADAPISPAVKRHFLSLYSESPESLGSPVEIRNSVIYTTSMKPPRGFTEFILSLLNQAEALVAGEQDFERQKQQAATHDKQEFLKRLKQDEN